MDKGPLFGSDALLAKFQSLSHNRSVTKASTNRSAVGYEVYRGPEHIKTGEQFGR